MNYIIAMACASLLLMPSNRGYAQNTGWSFPQTIPSFDSNFSPPILVADRNRTIHAFSTQFIETPEAEIKRVIVYNKWTLETGWTPPIDIIFSPIKEARVTDVYLDQDGYFHLLFFGGDGEAANIYYTWAPLSEAGNARAWMKPFIVGDKATDPENAVFAQTDAGKFVVIYTGGQFGNGLYVVASEDRGNSWSFPLPIFIASEKVPNISYLRALKSETGWLHIIWAVYDVNGQGRGIYYARSPDGVTWDQPTLLAETPSGLGSQTPTSIEHQGVLFAIYILPPTVVMQRSEDNGLTWQDPAILFPRHVGVNGSLSPVIDGNNDLHLFFGQRITGNPDIHGMWHSVWVNPRWTEPDAIVKGPQVNDLIGLTSFDPYGAKAVISQGNVVMVTWRTDPGNKGNGVWFSYQKLNVPEYPIVVFVQPTEEIMAETPNSFLEEGVRIQPTLDLTGENKPVSAENAPRINYWNFSPYILALTGIFLLLIVLTRINSNRRAK